jgi:hypothetical protein
MVAVRKTIAAALSIMLPGVITATSMALMDTILSTKVSALVNAKRNVQAKANLAATRKLLVLNLAIVLIHVPVTSRIAAAMVTCTLKVKATTNLV